MNSRHWNLQRLKRRTLVSLNKTAYIFTHFRTSAQQIVTGYKQDTKPLSPQEEAYVLINPGPALAKIDNIATAKFTNKVLGKTVLATAAGLLYPVVTNYLTNGRDNLFNEFAGLYLASQIAKMGLSDLGMLSQHLRNMEKARRPTHRPTPDSFSQPFTAQSAFPCT